jgi:hypothetical protein
LISKSIKEIAETIVGNRMRAVLVWAEVKEIQ